VIEYFGVGVPNARGCVYGLVMRLAIALVLIGTTAYAQPGADPFDHRTPTSPPSSSSSSEPSSPPSAVEPTVVAPAHDSACACDTVDPGQPQRFHAKLFLATGVALWATSFAVNVYARHEYDNALRGLDTGSTPVSYDAARNQVNHYHDMSRYYGTGLFVAGTAALGAAAYLYFTAPKEQVRRTTVSPMVSGDQAGVSLAGSF
jgi:hypothetical protein